MTRRHLILIAFVLVAFVIGMFVFRPVADAPIVPEPETATTTDQAESTTETPAPVADPIFATAKTVATRSTDVAPQTATFIVEGTSFPVRVAAGSTLEEAMMQLKAEGVLSYKLRSYTGLGAFVEEIQGKANTSEYYWILHVNGKKSTTGISQMRISSGDVIEWKYEHKY